MTPQRPASKTHPPRLSRALLRLSLPDDDRGSSILGDLHEEYHDRCGNSPLLASLWYSRVAITLSVGAALYTAFQRWKQPPPQKSKSLSMDFMLQDLRYAARRLRQSPAFTLIAIAIIGLGVGANTAIFSVVNAVLFRPLPYDNASDMVRVFNNLRGTDDPGGISYPDFLDYRDNTDVFQAASAGSASFVSLVTENGAINVVCEYRSASFFSVTGLRPTAGRLFSPGDDLPSASGPVVVVSYNAWQGRYGGDPNLVGSTLRMNGHSVTVIGIGPEGFTGTFVGFATDYWMPWGSAVVLEPEQRERLEGRGRRGLQMNALLRPGVSVAQAEAALNAVAAGLAREYPETNGDMTVTVLPASQVRLHPEIDRALYPIAALLMVVVGLVLLVACTNLANLLLVRAASRRREVAVRLALGAGRARLVRQLVTESTLLGVVGGLVGLVLALATANALVRFQPPLPFTITVDLSLDTTVLGFALLLSVVTGLAFGLVPALSASRPNLVASLKDDSRSPEAGRSRFTLGDFLVVSQVAVSLILLIGAGLFVKSLRNTQLVDPGFDIDHTAVASFDVSLAGYRDEGEGRPVFDRFVERIAATPGVERVALASNVPLGMGAQSVSIRPPGMEIDPEETAPAVDYNVVSPEYFATMGIRLVHGRNFNAGDTRQSLPVAIVSETMARRYWHSVNVVGETFTVGRDADAMQVEVVGVARDTRVRSLGEQPRPYFYQPFAQSYQSWMYTIARTAGDPGPLPDVFRRELREIDGGLSFYEVQTTTDHLAPLLFGPRAGAALLSGFGVLAMILASIGLYGVIAFSVAQRTREVGIRIALGAREGEVTRMIMGEGMGVVAVGLAAGALVAWLAMKPLAMFLLDVSPTDPIVFTVVGLLLSLVAGLATYIPARRAAHSDPVIALRADG